MTVALQPLEPPPAPPVEVTTENIESVLSAAGCHGMNFPDVHNKPESLAEMKDYGPAAAIDFPHAEMISSLDGEQSDLTSDSTVIDRVELLRLFFDFMIDDVVAHDGRGLKSIAIRCLAAAWVANPARFGNIAACNVAESWGLHPSSFSEASAEFSRRMGGFRNGWQVHDAKNKPVIGRLHANAQN